MLKAASALSRNRSIRYATPDIKYQLQVTPNDPRYTQQWALQSIDARVGWDRSTGSRSVIVAVLDSGITLDHPDLTENIWTNPNPGQNGYVDDVHGWNFISEDNNPSDDFGHGTHVSGIIGAVGNNEVGVTGVNWSVSLMPLKICNGEGLCDLSDEIAALEYAVDHGAKVANASFGGTYGGYQPEEEAIQAAGEAGLLYVAAAGNNSSSNDAIPFYPASYPLENMISVAATTSSDALASFSNYGATSVELGAPGQGVMSTLPTSGPLSSSSGYGELSGTSMAAPQVAGAAALLWSLHPSWTMQQIRTRLLTTGRPTTPLFGKASSCGELDLGAATDPAVPERASVCVALIGSGSGSVSSSPAGIDCGSSCETSVTPGTPVTLSATAAPGSTFAGWRGACTGTGTCTVSPTAGASIIAIFRTPGTPAGWEEEPLAPPGQREPFAPGSSSDFTFSNVSLSADGTVRAKTIYNPPNGTCYYASSDTGGVFLEHKTPSGWVADGSLTAPAVGDDSGARWANCQDYGAVTELSRDGSTLLVSQSMGSTDSPELGSRYRCAAFVYRHGAGGWALDGTLFPPGIGPSGSPDIEGCDYFGIGGAISEDGTWVAVLGGGGRADVFARGASGWSLEQHIVLPGGPGCTHTIGPKQIALSGDGATLLLSQPECETSGYESSGRVYAYTRSGSTWSLAQTIDSPEAQRRNYFGDSIAISGDGSTAAFDVGSHSSGLPPEAGASWIYEHDSGGWHAATRLTAPTPEENGGFGCPTIIENGSRIICGTSDTIGFDNGQGAMYIFERASSGAWTSSGSSIRLFATDGAAYDYLGSAGSLGWRAFAAAADGSLIDATISSRNLVNGTYPNDRVGYEFRAALPAPPTITSLSPTAGKVGSPVTIIGTNLRGASAISFGGGQTNAYSIDSDTQITATVPAAASSGPISVTTQVGTATSAESFTVLPSLTTTASPSITVGEQIHDSATLSGGTSPTGTISFRLYASSDTACSNPLGATLSTEVTHGNGAYESPPITESAPGTYQWVASYSGDEANAPMEAACNDPSERVVVQAQPSLTTTAFPTTIVGEQIHDSAALSAGQSSTGTITFTLYGPNDATCASGPAYTSTAVAVSGNGSYDSPPFTPTALGTYRWTATYSGDPNNSSVATACNDANETVIVSKADPTLSTNASPGIVLGAGQLTDSASINERVNPVAGATVTFSLYGPDDATCTTTPVFSSTAAYSVAGGPVSSAAFTPSQAGTYRWTAAYSGDADNEPVTGACNAAEETVTVAKASPVITTNAVPTATVGEAIHDTATLSGGTSPTGTISFRLYASSDTACSNPLGATLSTEVTHGNGAYESPPITESAPGTYQWVASYSGDENNAPLKGACDDPSERVVVLAQPVDIERVVIESASQSTAIWREGNGLAQISRQRHVPIGTTFSIRLNVAATVLFDFTHRVEGRTLGKRCVAPTRRNRQKRKCSRTVTAGTLRFPGHAGTNTVPFQGRLSATKKLRPSHYTLIMTARNFAGQPSNSKSLSLTILR